MLEGPEMLSISVRERKKFFENAVKQEECYRTYGEDDKSQVARQYAQSQKYLSKPQRAKELSESSSGSQHSSMTPRSSFENERYDKPLSPMSSWDELTEPEPLMLRGKDRIEVLFELLASLPNNSPDVSCTPVPGETTVGTSDEDSAEEEIETPQNVSGDIKGDSQEEKVIELKTKIRESHNHRQVTEQRVIEVEDAIKTAHGKISRLEEQLQDQKDRFLIVRDLDKRQLDRLQKRIDSLQNDMETRERERRELQRQLEQKDQRIKELERQLEEAKREIEELDKQRRQDRAQHEAMLEAQRAVEDAHFERQAQLEKMNRRLEEWREEHQRQVYHQREESKEREWALRRPSIEDRRQRSRSRDRDSKRSKGGKQQLALSRPKRDRREVTIVR
ncbi:hypothetical protein FZEAL_4607 [Fusarium zealandicum]|uniref:Uncharacterized protein n=1 Tax=Fusarium zealandicum TaxID=1053134 RepID=A0A8H4ULG3_9HYPO|nr:hypothetical protein FZEAL_4607 [Fusarium zealandicum]